MLKFFIAVIMLVLISCLGGVDVTNDPDFYYGYRKGQIYESNIDLYIAYGWDNSLWIPGEYSPKIEEYLQNPTKFNDIKGVLKKNSMVQIEKLSYRETFEASYLDVFARILDGEYKNELVKLNIVSEIEVKAGRKGGAMPKPDPKILKLVGTH